MRLRSTLLGLILLAFLFWVPAANADEERMAAREKMHKMLSQAEELHRAGRHEEAEKVVRKVEAMKRKLDSRYAQTQGGKDLRKILAGLEHGLKALRALGGHEEAQEHLQHAIHRVKREMEHKRHASDDGAAAAKKQNHALRFARAAMLEQDRKDLAEIVERAMHANELRLAGKRGDVEMPKREHLIEILNWSAKLYREWDNPDRADICAQQARTLQGNRRERDVDRMRNREREVAREQLEIMRIAFHGIREAENRKAAEMMEHAIHAHELRLEGRRDEEAMRIYRTAPKREQLVELLQYAAQLWRKFENADKAEACLRLANQLRGNRGQRAKSERGDKPDLARAVRRLEQMEKRLARLEGTLKEVEQLLRELRRRK